MANQNQVQEVEEVAIHGDMLEVVLSHVRLIDLALALHVSKSWNQAVYSSLRTLKPPKPWLLLHTQAVCRRAYDPRSHVWVKISQPPLDYRHSSTLNSSNSNFLYMLSSSKLSFSFDPLNVTWFHVNAPLAWRPDPIVAKVGHSIVVAGGACDFEQDPLAVEAYNINSRKWRTCKSLPATLKDSAASTWISAAATSNKLFLIEKQSSLLHFFEPESNNWFGPINIRPEARCFSSVIGCFNDDWLILVGLIGDCAEKVEKVKIWEVGSESFERSEIGEMPLWLVEKLNHGTFGTCINICLGGNFVYIYNRIEVEEVVVCELVNGGGCRWSSISCSAACGGGRRQRLVFTCSEIKVEDLDRAMRLNNVTFEEIQV